MKKKIIIGILAAAAVIVVGIIAHVVYENTQYADPFTPDNSDTILTVPSVPTHPCSESAESFGLYWDKPIIYLYPEETTKVTVCLGKPENITCSYPEYKNGWDVIANPDGTLIDTNTGRKLYALYWEGIQSEPIPLEDGFVVKGSDTIKFLEEKLAILGLTETEAEEFIVYWLPKLQGNKYNYIRFATIEEINENMPLRFSVEPDTIIRILMQYKALDHDTEVKEQTLEAPERRGYVVVEWGGMRF